MGKGGSEYHERQLTPEERALIAKQGAYLDSIQPSINKLVNTGTGMLDEIVTPDWQSLYTQGIKDADQIRGEQFKLSQGILPQQYQDAKMGYFRNMYQNTMGKELAKMAQNGVVNSSRFTTTTNDIQRRFADEMGKSYASDMQTQKGLLDQRWEMAKAPMQYAKAAQDNSIEAPAKLLGLAQGQSGQINQALSSQGQLNNGRGYVVQKGPGFFGGLMSGVGSYFGGK